MRQSNPNPARYLAGCEIIDIQAPSIRECAGQLRTSDEVLTARNCFEFVRDTIAHSSDYQRNPVTCIASDVLKHGTGYCYAKSHLLCALLRANGIPAGLCYQRLAVDGVGPPFCLHGLSAAYLEDFGWYRIDPRGNRADVNAQFSPPEEQLAFPIQLEGERDFPGIYQRPHDTVIRCLQSYDDWQAVCENLPDDDLGHHL